MTKDIFFIEIYINRNAVTRSVSLVNYFKIIMYFSKVMIDYSVSYNIFDNSFTLKKDLIINYCPFKFCIFLNNA